MPSRSVRSAAALALAVSATSFAYVGTAAPAQAAAYNGYCKTSSGVTVVVDFRGLGGGVAIRCSPVGNGATGLQALQSAGIPVDGVRGMGLSVACRIYGKPTATQDLPGGYHESCARMPPTKAYWSYWHASNGGSWGYSQEGLANSHVIPGGFEGWAFSEGSNVAPSVAPSRPANSPKPPPATHTTTQPPAPSRHTTTTAPKHPTAGHSAAGKHGGSGSDGSEPKSTTASKASKAAKKKAAEKKASSSAAHASKASKSKHSKGSSSSAAGGVTGTSSGGPTNVAGGAVANSDDLIKDSKKSSSINATTVVGGGVLGALAIGGGAVAIIRRRSLGQ